MCTPIIALPEAPTEDFSSDGPRPDNFEVPPEAMGAGPVFKRHGDKANPSVVTKKTLRCSQILAPVLVSMIVHAISGQVYIHVCTVKDFT